MRPICSALAALLFLVGSVAVSLVASASPVATPAHDSIAYDSFMARAARVKDGDSVIVRRENGRLSEIRLAGVDAPEMAQPGGREAKAALARMLVGQDIRVDVTDRDRYDRLVAMLWVGDLYVNAEMARTGNAWAFARYLPDPRIRVAHDEARAAKRGLWGRPESEQLVPAAWRMTHPYRARALQRNEKTR